MAWGLKKKNFKDITQEMLQKIWTYSNLYTIYLVVEYFSESFGAIFLCAAWKL